MIIDGHAYCFPPIDDPAGYDSLDEKLHVVQKEFGGHHQPVWRVRDRAPANNSTLLDQATLEPHSVRWTRDSLGRFVWEYDGEAYTKQYFPPMLYNLESTPEMLIAEMDYIGVDMAILHQSPHLGLLNGFLNQVVARYPDRLMRLIKVREGDVPLTPDKAIEVLESEVKAGDRCGLQFVSKFYYQGGHTEPWDDGAMRPFWETVAALRIPVYFTFWGARPSASYSSAEREVYIEENRSLLRWMDRYPDLTVVLTHGIPWRSYMEDSRITFPDNVWDVFKAPQCNLQLLFPISLGAIFEYPWKELEPAVKECVEHVGADRLIWGTDMPMVARFCTYRQTMDQYRVHCDFLSDDERASILGGTAARVMGIENR